MPVDTRSLYFVGAVLEELHLVICLCSEEVSRSAIDKRGRSIAVHEYQRFCKHQRDPTSPRATPKYTRERIEDGSAGSFACDGFVL